MSGARSTLFASLFALRACAFSLYVHRCFVKWAHVPHFAVPRAALMAGRQPLYKLLANEAAS
jgi:hypothetical protein